MVSQFLNGIGGLFKPFADIVLLSLLVNILPRRFYFRQIVKTVILSLSCIFSLVELFIIGKYYTFTTAGIVSVIIGTNPHEAIEFICMYFSWQYLILLIFLSICIYLLKIFQNRIKLPDFLTYSPCLKTGDSWIPTYLPTKRSYYTSPKKVDVPTFKIFILAFLSLS